MALVSIDPGRIAGLETEVAMHGSMRAGEVIVDDVFELIVAVANLVYELG